MQVIVVRLAGLERQKRPNNHTRIQVNAVWIAEQIDTNPCHYLEYRYVQDLQDEIPKYHKSAYIALGITANKTRMDSGRHHHVVCVQRYYVK